MTKAKKSKHQRTFSAEKLHILQQKVKNVRDTLTQDQNETLNKFITKLEEEGLTPKDRKFCDENCLVRYLKARDFELTKAHKLLRGTLQWRNAFKVDQIAAEHLTEQACTGKLFRRGHDTFGRPVVYMTPKHENSKDYDKNLQLLVYTIERCVESMGEDVQQMVWVIDFNGFSLTNSPPISVALATLNILSNHYPERLGTALLVDTPWLFGAFWKAISPFINPVTYNKIVFVKGEAEKQKVFARYFDLNTIEKRFGGKLDFKWDNSSWQNEIALDQARFKRLGIAPAAVNFSLTAETPELEQQQPEQPVPEEVHENLSAEELNLD